MRPLREVYGHARLRCLEGHHRRPGNPDGSPINDCLGHPNGSVVDNIEDVDTVVGWLAESDPPARLRDLRDPVRGVHPERLAPPVQRPFLHLELPAGVLHQMGVNWVNHNGPEPEMMETGTPNGHTQPVLPSSGYCCATFRADSRSCST